MNYVCVLFVVLFALFLLYACIFAVHVCRMWRDYAIALFFIVRVSGDYILVVRFLTAKKHSSTSARS